MRSSELVHATTLVVALLGAGCAKAPPVTPTAAPVPLVDPVTRLRQDFDALIDRPGHLHGTWGIVVESLTGNDRLYERNPRTLMVPASTMKLVAVATAADAVGWDYRFKTRFFTTGGIADGVLHGDLLIVGNGDPSLLGPPHTELERPWLRVLRDKGITRVEGRVIGDDDDVEEPRPGFAWSWEDMGYAYGAIPGALNVGENVATLTVSPGNAEGLPTIIEMSPSAPEIEVVNHTTTSTPGTQRSVWPELRPGDAALSIHGTVPADGAPMTVAAAVGNPTVWFARVVRNDLLVAGIDVTGPAVDIDDVVVKPNQETAVLLHTHQSVPLSEIAKPLLKDSINLYAESVLRLATGREGVRTTGAALDATRLRLEGWGIPKDGIQIVDGSGLSRRNVVAAETLVSILKRFHDPAGTSPWMQAFPVAGRDGSLENRMKGTPAEGIAIAKTGTMSNIRAIAGYVKTADGEPLAFAIIANNFEGPGTGVTATIDALVVRLATFTRVATSAR